MGNSTGRWGSALWVGWQFCETVKDIIRGEWKQHSAGLSGEDRQVKTDDARPGDCPIILVPLRHMWLPRKPWVATSGQAYLEAGGLRGHRAGTKGDLSDKTKQRLAGYRQAKRGEDPRHVFCFCIAHCPPPTRHQPVKMTPRTRAEGFYFSVYNMWPACVYISWGYVVMPRQAHNFQSLEMM